MASFGKMIFYDWAGGNELLFRAVNHWGSGEIYDNLMMGISRLSDYKNFPYYFLMLCICAFTDFAMRKLRGRGGANHALVAWLGVLCVVACSFAIDGGMVRYIKSHAEFGRPYVAMPAEEVTLLEYSADREDDFHSFPSGHASFVAMLVTALWPVFSASMKRVGQFCIVMVCWSRLAVGMHFPADLVYAVLLAISVTYLVRWFLYRQLFLRLHLKC